MVVDDDSTMAYGQFKGQQMGKIPAWYLLWMYDNGKLWTQYAKYVDDNRVSLEQEVAGS